MHDHPSGDPTPSQADIHIQGDRPDRHPARHFRARPHYRRQERACEFEGVEADLMRCQLLGPDREIYAQPENFGFDPGCVIHGQDPEPKLERLKTKR